MAYDESLANRVRARLRRRPGFAERKMFGGLCFLLHGRMCAGVLGDRLIVRVAADEYAPALARPHTEVFDMTGRTMKGFVVVRSPGCNTGKRLADWLEHGTRVARTHARKPRGRAARRHTATARGSRRATSGSKDR